MNNMTDGITINPLLFKLLLWAVGLFFFLSMALLFYVFPWVGLCWNRWKLKLRGKKGFTPVYMRMKNRKIKEVVVDTRQSTFSHDDKMYNVREDAIQELYGFKCLFYEHDNPEPLKMITDDEQEILVKMNDGKIQPMRGKLVDAKQYDNTCNLFYWAGFAKANRLKSYLMLVLIIVGVLVLAFGIVNYSKTGSTAKVCGNAVGMLQNATVYIKYNLNATGGAALAPSGMPPGTMNPVI